ncbi:chromosome segregation protein SMC [Amaricoccus macauensis]|uniref:chromosome segregation protein SMC n=1 Tax=Amaricoccus macauensis TaxID=57001 RepID=UPI003C7D80E1
MHFTRLRLVGFKSFVDPTELLISPGLTGVVGPNGCGKSNLLEALRWVMGENRAKAMRGSGMEDVIFAGSGDRPARNHAEVTLTLDNRERLAPAAFNASDTLEVIRRITRDAGSAYRANGKEARARDVQMLFADASTGAHSPALVRQGQISELINAKPTARRRVLEEAAGISGLYQRRHEAELKLRATETNLERVADVLDALDAQISTLERQAKQARRYREIAEALRHTEALLLWRLWRDAESDREQAAAALMAATRKAGVSQTEAASALKQQAEAEEAIPALREEDAIAGAVLQRLTIERDRQSAKADEARRQIDELEAKKTQIAADLSREAALNSDADGMIAKLREEAEALEAEGDGHDEALEVAREIAEEAAAGLAAAEARLDAKSQESAKLIADHRAAQRALEEARKREAEAGRALAQNEEALAKAEAELEAASEALETAAEEADFAAHEAGAADEALAEAEALMAETQAQEQAIRARLADAEGAERALATEVSGLERLLGQDTGSVDQILDAITVEPGFEAALGAVFAEELALPALDGTDGASGWRALPDLEPQPFPSSVAVLARHVTAPPELARRLAATGIVEAAEAPALQASLRPGQCLVSRDGDLWRWDGLSMAAGSAPSAAALRLQQKNRLATLTAERDEAQALADELRGEASDARAARDAARDQEAQARRARKAAEQAANDTARALARAQTARETLEGRLETLNSALRRRKQDMEELAAARAKAEGEAGALADPALAQAAVDEERTRVEAARILMMTRRAEADELDRAGKARERRLQDVAREADGWAKRQANAAGRLADLERRALATEEALTEARALPEALKDELEQITQSLEEAEARRRKASDALAEAETRLRSLTAAAREAEKTASEAREGRARVEALSEAAEIAAAAAAERIEAERNVTPQVLIEQLGDDPTLVQSADALDARAGQLRRQRDGLGAVNLRAEEDSREVIAEREALVSEKSDLEEAIRKLRQGIANLNREGRERLLEAFDEVNRNFAMLFRHLFGGGEANLVLVESDDPLEAGLEIMCQPPGKKLSTLSLLSGGEQTLTALSLIFAVFLANPSPICVLDEVDAPLDDANVTRFCDLLDEMTRRTKTRFLIITHHAVTMGRMDRLFGVTMAEQGVSKLVSVDLAAAERIMETAVA